MRKFADFHYSSELNATATLDDLSYDYMCEYVVRVGAREDTRALPKAGMARALGLVGGASGERTRNFAARHVRRASHQRHPAQGLLQARLRGHLRVRRPHDLREPQLAAASVTIEDLNEQEGFNGRG